MDETIAEAWEHL
jgi:hypothetical protein